MCPKPIPFLGGATAPTTTLPATATGQAFAKGGMFTVTIAKTTSARTGCPGQCSLRSRLSSVPWDEAEKHEVRGL